MQPTANMFGGVIKMFQKDWCTVCVCVGGVIGKEEQKIKLGVEKKKVGSCHLFVHLASC